MKKQKNTEKFHLCNDIILVVALLFMSAVCLLYLFVFRKGGNVVKVTIDGEIYGTYSLSNDMSQEILTGDNFENSNIFVIRDGKVYMQEASCPDGICVAHRPIFRDGESIVCLPNRVVITVSTKDSVILADIVA